MIHTARYLFARDNDLSLSPLMMNLLIALLVLVITALVATGILYILKAVRKSRKGPELPMYNEKPVPKTSNHRRLTITATPYGRRSESVIVYQEKQSLIENSSSPPPSPVPEIRITFPDEVDESGKRQSGRVVVVRVGDQSVGLEPVQEGLPPYQQNSSDRFQSLDLERIGGLKEKQ